MSEKKTEFIQMNLRCCESNLCKAYPYGSIPERLLKNACMSYVNQIYGQTVRRGDVLGMIDSSIMGNGKAGVLFTEEGIFFKNTLEKPGYISYKEMKKSGFIPEAIYINCNQPQMKKLITGLINIDEKEKWKKQITTINEKIEMGEQALDTLDETIDNVFEVGERIVDILVHKVCKK